MQSTRTLDRFDARSLVLFATLTMGGTQAVLAQHRSTAPVVAQTATAPAATHAGGGNIPALRGTRR